MWLVNWVTNRSSQCAAQGPTQSPSQWSPQCPAHDSSHRMSESDRLPGESEVQSQTVCCNFVDVGVESGDEPLERGGGGAGPLLLLLVLGWWGQRGFPLLNVPSACAVCCVGCMLVLMKWMGMMKAHFWIFVNRVAIHPRAGNLVSIHPACERAWKLVPIHPAFGRAQNLV